VDQTSLAKQTQAAQQLLGKDSHKSGAQSSELVLLDELVQVDRQQLEYQTQVLFVDESILESENVVVVVLIHTSVELHDNSQPILVTFVCNILLLTRSRTETSIIL
jgi:hypothetical protein